MEPAPAQVVGAAPEPFMITMSVNTMSKLASLVFLRLKRFGSTDRLIVPDGFQSNVASSAAAYNCASTDVDARVVLSTFNSSL